MNNELRVVIDTSVAVSAILLPHGVPRRAFDVVLANGVLLVSEATIVELDEVLRRPKFDRYIQPKLRLELLAVLVSNAEVVEVSSAITDCRDPKDNKFLELAESGRASHILSGDSDLLVLHPFRGIAIVSPQVFLASVAPSQS